MEQKVYLVGAGSGDPELLTLKGWRALSQADVILYDRLVSPILLYLANTQAELIYVGKRRSHHALKQDEINQLLVDLYRQGKTVVRLKGGDPTVYGRVAEEMAVLDAAQIPYEVVPGITSAFSATSYAGIIATERHQSEKVSILTPAAILHDLAEEPILQAVDGGTVVLYMGLNKLPYLVEILQNKQAGTVPIAVIEWGTLGRQRKIISTVDEVLAEVQEKDFESPSLIVLGSAVARAPQQSWFEKLPHFGESYIYVTDDKNDLAEIMDLIQQGADIYPMFVEAAYDKRFNDVHTHYVPRYHQVQFKNELLQQKYEQEIERMMVNGDE